MYAALFCTGPNVLIGGIGGDKISGGAGPDQICGDNCVAGFNPSTGFLRDRTSISFKDGGIARSTTSLFWV